MKSFTWKFAAMTGFAVVALLAGSQMSFAEGEIYGTMMVVKGDIKVTSAKSGKTDAAKVGFKVYSGDAITSGADSRAKIIMSDKNVINVSPDSKVTIAKYENNPAKDSRNVELKVDYGKVRASVEQNYDGDKNKFNVRTPTAVAGVRGTDFVAGFNSQTRQTSVVTFSGVVAVGSPGPNGQIANAVFVKPGQATNVGEGQKPEAPKAVPKDQMQNMNQESSADTAKGSSSTTDSPGSTAKTEDTKKEDAKADEPKADSAETKGDAKADAPADAKADQPKDTAKADKSAAGPEGSAPSDKMARSPASVDTPSMAPPVDIDLVPLPTAPAERKAPPMPPVPLPRQPTPLPTVTNPFIENTTRNQKSRVRVEIVLPK